MPPLPFTRNDYPTLGIEIELAIIDADTLALRSGIADVLDRLPPDLEGQVKPELMQCYLEINTGICRTVSEARADLVGKLCAVHDICRSLGMELLWTGTHPFSSWRDQEITPNDRYQKLVGLMQDVARRLVTFGLHVHVGVDSGDKAVMVCDRMLRHLPTLLALSANSPFWEGRATGLAAYRSKVMDSLPTAGLPSTMRNWSEYVWLVNHLIETGFIHTIREIWWDIRPHHNFGTVEVRICDMPPSLEDVLALAALVQCLVDYLSREIDEGAYLPDSHPMMVLQNKWRAVRFGLDAQLVDSDTYESKPARQVAGRMVELLRTTAERLDCAAELQDIHRVAAGPSGAERQLNVFAQQRNRKAVVRYLLEHGREGWLPAPSDRVHAVPVGAALSDASQKRP